MKKRGSKHFILDTKLRILSFPSSSLKKIQFLIHSDLPSIWLLATMLAELSERKKALGLFELGQNLCTITDPTDDGVVIYDWLFAAVTCWRYRKLSKAKEYLDWAEGMVDDDTQEEFNAVQRRIKTAPFQAIWTQCNLKSENGEEDFRQGNRELVNWEEVFDPEPQSRDEQRRRENEKGFLKTTNGH